MDEKLGLLVYGKKIVGSGSSGIKTPRKIFGF